MKLIKGLALTLLLSPLALLPTSRPATSLRDIRQREGLLPPRPANQTAAQPIQPAAQLAQPVIQPVPLSIQARPQQNAVQPADTSEANEDDLFAFNFSLNAISDLDDEKQEKDVERPLSDSNSRQSESFAIGQVTAREQRDAEETLDKIWDGVFDDLPKMELAIRDYSVNALNDANKLLSATHLNEVERVKKILAQNPATVNMRDQLALMAHVAKQVRLETTPNILGKTDFIKKANKKIEGELEWLCSMQSVRNMLQEKLQQKFREQGFRRLGGNGFTPLMIASARGCNDLIRLLLSHNAVIHAPAVLALVDPTTRMNADALASRLAKDSSKRPVGTKGLKGIKKHDGKISLAEALGEAANYNLFGFRQQDAISLASIGGHKESIDLLLNSLPRMEGRAAPELSRIRDIFAGTIENLLDCSTIAESSKTIQEAAAALFQALGIPAMPHFENYPVIARNLIQTLRKIQAICDQELIRIMQARYDINGHDITDITEGFPSIDGVKRVLRAALIRGSLEMLEIIAGEYANVPAKISGLSPNQILYLHDSPNYVTELCNGEKLGALLAMDAHPESVLYVQAMSLLSHVEKNPKLLARLKQYVGKLQQERAHLNTHLQVPDLSRLVAGYVSHDMPQHIAEYILALEPAQQAQIEDLGQDVAEMEQATMHESIRHAQREEEKKDRE